MTWTQTANTIEHAEESRTTLPAPVPSPRGRLSRALTDRLITGRTDSNLAGIATDVVATSPDIIRDDDVQLALHLLYRLHLDGLPGVDDNLEWAPDLLDVAGILEARFETRLRNECTRVLHRVVAEQPHDSVWTPSRIRSVVRQLTELNLGPSLSGYVSGRASLEQVRELLILKSLYQLKEADPHTFAIPRVHGRTKAGLVEIQADEYGNGRRQRMHSTLFVDSLRGAGLDTRPGAYLDHLPAAVLAADNAGMFFGLHRRLRGAALGHLAALEMTSSTPMRRYARGLRRLGLASSAVAYFDEHVAADAVHEQVAMHDMILPFLADFPDAVDAVLLGVSSALVLDALTATATVEAWQQTRSALRSGAGSVQQFTLASQPEAAEETTESDTAARRRRSTPEVLITVTPDGPILVRGSATVVDSTGAPMESAAPTIALCRCGHSRTKPYCDGTHKSTGFTAS